MRRVSLVLLAIVVCASAMIALATAAVWIRSIWIAEWVASEAVGSTSRGGQWHANTVIYTLPGGLLLLRQLNDGPTEYTSPVDSRLQWYREPNETVAFKDLWFRASFTHYSLPPKGAATIGDRGYTLELGIPDWAIILVFLALPAWQFWRYRRSRHQRRRGFEPIDASEKDKPQTGTGA